MFETIAQVAAVGIGATALADLWAAAMKRTLQLAAPDWGLVGRWVAHMPGGRFVHPSIVAAAPVRHERTLGLLAHYAVGIAFAGLMVAFAGADWPARPTPGPALVLGLASVAAPFLIMQPAFGLGLAAAKSPAPSVARLRSLMNHLAFGVGLYLSGLVGALLW